MIKSEPYLVWLILGDMNKQGRGEATSSWAEATLSWAETKSYPLKDFNFF